MAEVWAGIVIHRAFAIVVGNGTAISHASGQQAGGQQQSSNDFHRSIRASLIRTVRRRQLSRQGGIA